MYLLVQLTMIADPCIVHAREHAVQSISVHEAAGGGLDLCCGTDKVGRLKTSLTTLGRSEVVGDLVEDISTQWERVRHVHERTTGG